MIKTELLLAGLATNLIAALFMFVMGSLIPYLQLYTYRMSLGSGNFHQIYLMDSAIMQVKTSASDYICKDIAKRIPIHFEQTSFLESTTRRCAEILNEREDSVAYALLGRLNVVAWTNTKDQKYFSMAERYFLLSTNASPQNEIAIKIKTEGQNYLQMN